MTTLDRIRLDRERQLRKGPPNVTVIQARVPLGPAAKLVTFKLDAAIWDRVQRASERSGKAFGVVMEEAIRVGLASLGAE